MAKKPKRELVFKQSEGFVLFHDDPMGSIQPFLDARGADLSVCGNKNVYRRLDRIQELVGKRSQWMGRLTDALGYTPQGRRGWYLSREGIMFHLSTLGTGIRIRVSSDLKVREQTKLLDDIILALEGA